MFALCEYQRCIAMRHFFNIGRKFKKETFISAGRTMSVYMKQWRKIGCILFRIVIPYILRGKFIIILLRQIAGWIGRQKIIYFTDQFWCGPNGFMIQYAQWYIMRINKFRYDGMTHHVRDRIKSIIGIFWIARKN